MIIAIYVDDPDAVAASIVDIRARVIFDADDQPYGERGGRLADPFGHAWMIAARSEDLTAEQVQERTTAMYPAE